MPVGSNILAGSSGQGTGYDIDQSVRLEDSRSTYLSRTPSGAGNLKTWSLSFWKKSEVGNTEPIFSCGSYSGGITSVYCNSSGRISVIDYSSSAYNVKVYFEPLYRDPSAWAHYVVVFDSSNGSSTDRVRLYKNGERVTEINSSGNTFPSSGFDGKINSTGLHMIGRDGSASGDYGRGYLAEMHFLDGTAVTDASSFGETNSATNQWVPVEYSGSYGTNGFYEKFSSTELANSFTDSAEGHAVIANGDVHTDTSVKKIGTASAQFDGTGDALTIPGSSDFQFGTGDFTIECWHYAVGTPGTNDGIISWYEDSTSGPIIEMTGAQYQLYEFGNTGTHQNVSAFTTDQWNHIALVRNSAVTKFYLNGSETYSVSDTQNYDSVMGGLVNIGRFYSLGYYMNGYLDEIRISDTARYTGTFTPSTTEFTNDANTMLLLHCDGSDSGTTFTDSSTRPRHTITANGDVTNTRAQYKVGDSSIKFDGTGDYLSTASSGMGLTGDYTIECWFNTASSTNDNGIISNKYNNSSFNGNFSLRLNDGGNSNDIAFRPYNGTVAEGGLVTSGTGAWSDNTWTHVAVVRSGSGTGNVKMYIGGSLAGTSSGASSSTILGNAGDLNIGRQESASAGTNYLNGYMDEIRISSSARYTGTFTPSTTAFTADANTLLLIHSDFNGGLGADSSGNKNDFSPVNVVATDQVLDSPSRNYCTLNPLVRSYDTPNYSEGNLQATGAYALSSYGTIASTMSISSGKWYWEVYQKAVSYVSTGIKSDSALTNSAVNPQDHTGTIIYYTDGTKRIDGSSSSYGATYATGDIVGVALDLDSATKTITFYKNNATQGAITISGGCASAASIVPSGITLATTDVKVFNFGQDDSFANNKTSGSAAASDANGIGTFFYTPPTGHKALNTFNLDDPAIALPTAHFNTKLYTGTGSELAVTNVGFQPDFTWIKTRQLAYNHRVFDSVRGVTKELYTNTTGAEVTDDPQTLKSFDSDGFTLGTSSGVNPSSSSNMVSWNWKAASSNTVVSAGSIDGTNPTIATTRRTNTTAGFSIATYTGNNTAEATIAHGLSQRPDLVIIKDRENGSTQWVINPIGALGSNYYGYFTTGAFTADSSNVFWYTPTSTVVKVSAHAEVNASSTDYVMYCFNSIEGYSKVGKYSSNNSVDGPFIYLGFTPAYILLKCITATDNWNAYDIKRNGYNGTGGTYQIRADTTGAGFTSAATMVDLVSNGMKIRTNDPGTNGSGRDYLFYAVASNPFKTSNAR